MDINVKDLRKELKTVLDHVEQGEECLITRRGRPVARILPITRKATSGEQHLPGFGTWADREDLQNPAAWVRSQRQGRYPSSPASTELSVHDTD